MTNYRYRAVLGIFATLCVATCFSLIPGLTFSQTIRMQSYASLPGTGGTPPQVFGGEPVTNPSKWPATFVFRNSGGGGCTATAIGSRVILTASHCVENGATAVLPFRGQEISLTCDRHPDYPTDIASDYALCLTQQDLGTAGFQFETVDSDSSRPAAGDEVGLLGYGCITQGGADHEFGTLYEGIPKVSLARDTVGFVQTKGTTALCFGDSGGGAYIWLNRDKTIRHVFGVNARGDIASISFLAPTASPKFSTFAKRWATAKGVKICGLDPDAPSCRQ